MTLFGDRNAFALEMISDADSPPFGIDACMWGLNTRIGNPRPWFGTYVNYLEGYLEPIRDRTFATLPDEMRDQSTPELIGSFLGALAGDWIVGDHSIERFMIFNLDDSLDGWHLFITELDDQCRIMWSQKSNPTPIDFECVFIKRKSLIDALSGFLTAGRRLINAGGG